jgi:DNA end-binding protein Ku
VGANKKRRRPGSHPDGIHRTPFHAFWSGSLSFGLVNVRVLLFPANRQSGIHLRMMSPEGSFLERRFFCPRDNSEVRGDEIIRGFELDDGSYVTVEDEELEALEPQKSQEISLKEFVPLSELGPVFLERGYYLTPQKEAAKAYRLLAEVIERTGRAGIATFVMRDREYLVAIFARDGILCAETLRFHDETRTAASLGLPEVVKAPPERVSAFEKAIDAISAKALPKGELRDEDDEKLMAIIRRKVKAGKDVIRVETESADAQVDDEEDGDGDLLEAIRRSLRGGGRSGAGHRETDNGTKSVRIPRARAAHSKHTSAGARSAPKRPRRRT